MTCLLAQDEHNNGGLVAMALLLSLSIGIAGCVEATEQTVWPVFVRVVDNEGIPMDEVTVEVDNRQVNTNSHGMAVAKINGYEGKQVTGSVRCPGGSRPAANSERRIVLRRLENRGRQSEPPDEEFICIPLQKEHVLIVRTNGVSGLPVQINGKTVGKTDSEGMVHTTVSGSSGEKMSLVVETDGLPNLVPRNPALVLTLPARRRFLVYEQFFHTPLAPKKRRKRIDKRELPRRL